MRNEGPQILHDQSKRTNKITTNVVVIFYLITFATMLLIDRGNTGISRIAYILVAGLFALAPLETEIVGIFCLLPFPRLFLMGGGLPTLIPVLELMIVAKWSFQRFRSMLIPVTVIMVFVMFAYSAIVEFARFSSVKNSVIFTLRIMGVIVICDKCNKRLAKWCFLTLIIGMLVSSYVGMNSPALSKFTALYQNEYVSRFQGLQTDPGTFGQLLIASIGSSIMLYMMRENKRRTVLPLLVTIGACTIALDFMIRSGTRASLLGIVVIAVILVWELLKHKNPYIKMLGVLIVLLALLYGRSLFEQLFNTLSENHGDQELAEDNRWSIWMNYMRHLKENPSVWIFGIGLDGILQYAAANQLGNPHNVLLEKLVECGIIGLVIQIMFFVAIIRHKRMDAIKGRALPMYAYLATLMVYGASGTEIPYYLLALTKGKKEDAETA